jgi:hypothetical protein
MSHLQKSSNAATWAATGSESAFFGLEAGSGVLPRTLKLSTGHQPALTQLVK